MQSTQLQARTAPASGVLSHDELDALLERLARDPDRFTRAARRLAARLELRRIDLELTPPEAWKSAPCEPGTRGRVTVEHQLRAEIERIRPLGRDQELRLARRIEFAGLLHEFARSRAESNGGEAKRADSVRVERRRRELHALRAEMVERNLYLVLINVARCPHRTVGRADLIQEGAVVLFRAVDGYDWRRGLLFRTYAVHWLHHAFHDYVYTFGHTVRLPTYIQKATKHIRSAVERLGDHGASVAAIAREAGLGEGVVASALAAGRLVRSFDGGGRDLDEAHVPGAYAAVDGRDDAPSSDVADPTAAASLVEALGRLSERERMVASMRFGIGCQRTHTLAEVGRKLGVSIERVRQIQLRALEKMRTVELHQQVVDLLA